MKIKTPQVTHMLGIATQALKDTLSVHVIELAYVEKITPAYIHAQRINFSV